MAEKKSPALPSNLEPLSPGVKRIVDMIGMLTGANDPTSIPLQPSAVLPITAKGGGQLAKQFLKHVDNLGFDSTGEAMGAIVQHPDWATRWDMTDQPPHVVDAINAWRASKVAENTKNFGQEVPPSTWDLVKAHLKSLIPPTEVPPPAPPKLRLVKK